MLLPSTTCLIAIRFSSGQSLTTSSPNSFMMFKFIPQISHLISDRPGSKHGDWGLDMSLQTMKSLWSLAVDLFRFVGPQPLVHNPVSFTARCHTSEHKGIAPNATTLESAQIGWRNPQREVGAQKPQLSRPKTSKNHSSNAPQSQKEVQNTLLDKLLLVQLVKRLPGSLPSSPPTRQSRPCQLLLGFKP